MSSLARSFVGAVLIGVVAGAAWIVLAEPAARVAAVDRPSDPPQEPVGVPSLESPIAATSTVETAREAAAKTAGAPEVETVAANRSDEPDPRVILFGSAKDPEGRPFASGSRMYLSVTNDRGDRIVSTIEEGNYSVAGLGPGDWNLAVRWPGLTDFDRHVVLAPTERMHREDIVLERAWSIGIVVRTPEGKGIFEEGGPVRGVHGLRLSAVATKDPPGERLPPTDLTHFVDYGVGRFFESMGSGGESADLPMEAIGRLIVLERPPVHVSLVARQFVLDSRLVDSQVQTLSFTLSADQVHALVSSLVLRVVDADTSRPIQGASVMISTSQSGTFSSPSDEDGFVRRSNLMPGRYSIRTLAHGFAVDTRNVDLEPAAETDLGAIPLSKPILLAGRIVDPDGHGLDAQPSLVEFSEDDPDRPYQATGFGISVDSDGRFRHEALSPGRYLLVFGAEHRHPPAQNEPDWTVPPVLIDTRAGPVDDLEIVLRRGVELVLKPTSPSLVGASFRIWTTDGRPYRRGRFYEPAPVRLLIAPGDYDFVLSRDETEIRRMRIDLPETGRTIEIEP